MPTTPHSPTSNFQKCFYFQCFALCPKSTSPHSPTSNFQNCFYFQWFASLPSPPHPIRLLQTSKFASTSYELPSRPKPTSPHSPVPKLFLIPTRPVSLSPRDTFKLPKLHLNPLIYYTPHGPLALTDFHHTVYCRFYMHSINYTLVIPSPKWETWSTFLNIVYITS